MSLDQIIRAWKDEEFRNSLTTEQRSLLPANPAGLLELTDEALDGLVAGMAGGSCVAASCFTNTN